ncbi:hypothetical protein StoSoilB13_18260 [Arthrobacter sp. StoSoilB13]|nr:hypothetical protein StoSoilB13_18260 [Arthrobacter sp. StoSoilB13]
MVGGVDEVLGAMFFSQNQAAGDVVVVQMGFGHMRDPDASGTRGFFNAVGVPLRVNDQSNFAVMHQVTPVPQCRGFDDYDVHTSG